LARTALPTTVLASLRRYRVELEGETLPAIAAFLDLEWSGGKGRLGVAVAQSGAVFGPMLFDDFGKPLDELDPLLAQFKGQRGVRLTEASLRPVGEVMTRRDAVMATSDPPPNP